MFEFLGKLKAKLGFKSKDFQKGHEPIAKVPPEVKLEVRGHKKLLKRYRRQLRKAIYKKMSPNIIRQRRDRYETLLRSVSR